MYDTYVKREKMKKESLGKKIKRLRTDRFLTQTNLAVKAGVSLLTIWRIENEKVDPHGPTIKVIARALGVRWTELVG